jgi:hypothetical protein
MLIPIISVWLHVTGPDFRVYPQPGADVMTDTLPFGNRFGFPFTRDEYRAALLQVYSQEEAEPQVRFIYEPDPETIGVTVMDGTLLLIAALSPELANRVVAYRPALKPLVERIRADPAEALRSWRHDL